MVRRATAPSLPVALASAHRARRSPRCAPVVVQSLVRPSGLPALHAEDSNVNDLMERLLELDRQFMAMLESAYLRATRR